MAESKERINDKRQPINVESTQPRESGVMKDVGEVEVRLPHEVKSWMEKIEEDPGQQVVNDNSGQPIMQPVAPTDPRIVLPITRKKFVEGFKKKIDEAGKWLSTFLFKVIKLKRGKIKFQEE